MDRKYKIMKRKRIIVVLALAIMVLIALAEMWGWLQLRKARERKAFEAVRELNRILESLREIKPEQVQFIEKSTGNVSRETPIDCRRCFERY